MQNPEETAARGTQRNSVVIYVGPKEQLFNRIYNIGYNTLKPILSQ